VNILLIDDDRDTAFLIDLLLKRIPFVDEYTIRLGAKEALEFISVYQKPLACIFVDVKMPEMDGFQFVQAFEKDFLDKFPDTLVYFLTSSARQSDKERAMKFGSVKDFLLKPLSKKQLESIHEELINH
jgi:CheY-like chemotaxis protein